MSSDDRKFDDRRLRSDLDDEEDDDLIVILFGVVLGIGVLMGVAAYLDATFGWGVTAALRDAFPRMVP